MASFAMVTDELLADWIIGEKKVSVIRVNDGNGSECIYVELTLAEEEGVTQKMASFTLQKWKYFCDNIEVIKTAARNYLARGREGSFVLHLGKNQFVSVTEGVACVDIRKWYRCSAREKLFPTKSGIALKVEEFNELCEQIPDINAEIESLDSVIPCQYTHTDMSEAQQCAFCTPSASFG